MEKWQEPETLILWLAIIIVVVVGLALAVILFSRMYFKRLMLTEKRLSDERIAYQTQLAENGIQILERERERVALELHDALISRLNAALLLNHADQRTKVQPMITDCIDNARRISHDLLPPLIENSSLRELIEVCTEELKLNYQIEMRMDIRIQRPLSSLHKLNLIRIIQEFSNNTIKHANADCLAIAVRVSEKWIVLRVMDNGVGFDAGQGKEGLGLQNIKLRAQMLQGHYRIRSAKGQGVQLLLMIPNDSQ